MQLSFQIFARYPRVRLEAFVLNYVEDGFAHGTAVPRVRRKALGRAQILMNLKRLEVGTSELDFLPLAHLLPYQRRRLPSLPLSFPPSLDPTSSCSPQRC